MLHSLFRSGLALAFLGLLLVPGTTWAQKDRPRKVSDEAKLFSADAIKEANGVIADIKKKHHKDLMIMTRESVDGNPAKWASKEADEIGIDGVLVLITTKPKHFEIYVGNKTREKYFMTDNRDRLKEILSKTLPKSRDQALGDVAHYTLEAMDKNVPAVAPPRQKAEQPVERPRPAPVVHPPEPQHPAPREAGGSPNILGWVCLIVAVLVVIWVVFALIRALTTFGGGGYGGYPGYGYGYGGGFFTGMLGGMFGAMAGMWMYNNLFGGHAIYTSNGMVDWSGGSASAAAGVAPYEADTSGTTAGGDWGDNDGGGDAGGGDAGGGGGDFGGGGGGGDW